MPNGFKKQKEVRGNSNEVHRAATPLALDVRWLPVRPGQVSETDFAAAAGGGAGRFTVNGKSVTAVKHYPGIGQRVQLRIHHSLTKFNPTTFEVTLENELDGRTAKFTGGDLELREPASGYLMIEFDVEEMLVTLGAAVNLNLVRASVEFTGTNREGAGVEGKGETEKRLHVVLQRVIVLLPGVMASSLWVDGNKCMPSLSIYTRAKNMERLRCKANGNPVNALTKIKFVEPGHPYDTGKWEGILNEGMPKLENSRGETLRYTFFQGWPYDWRRKADDLVAQLLGPEMSDDDVRKTHENWFKMFSGQPTFRSTSPSLRTIIRNLKRSSPFLHDKVALAGHSTGGMIMNGAVRSAGVEEVVDRAFFLATPFYGALKAYNAFLKGTMNLGFSELFVLTKDSFLKHGADLPVLYYLAPTSSFPYPVGKIVYPKSALADRPRYFNLKTAQNAPDEAKTFMEEVHRLARLHNIQSLMRSETRWNDSLARAAHDYHSVTCKAEIRIGVKNCLAVYSDYGPQSTIGTIQYDSNYDGSEEDGQISYLLTGGDETVPVESLKGPFNGDDKRLWKSSQKLDHVKILTDRALWKEIAKRLATEQKD